MRSIFAVVTTSVHFAMSARDVGANAVLELGCTRGARVVAQCSQPVDHRRLAQQSGHLGIEAGHDRWRHAGRRRKALPGCSEVARNPGRQRPERRLPPVCAAHGPRQLSRLQYPIVGGSRPRVRIPSSPPFQDRTANSGRSRLYASWDRRAICSGRWAPSRAAAIAASPDPDLLPRHPAQASSARLDLLRPGAGRATESSPKTLIK